MTNNNDELQTIMPELGAQNSRKKLKINNKNVLLFTTRRDVVRNFDSMGYYQTIPILSLAAFNSKCV